jgi:hypothetical protein
MSDKMELANFRPHQLNEFGSVELTIRSKKQSRHSLSLQNSNDVSHDVNDRNDPNQQHDLDQNQLLTSSQIEWNQLKKPKKSYRKSLKFRNFKNNQRGYNLVKENNIDNNDANNEEDEKETMFQQRSLNEFKYDSVTKNIYSNFGKVKQFNDYPQKIPQTQLVNKTFAVTNRNQHQSQLPAVARNHAASRSRHKPTHLQPNLKHNLINKQDEPNNTDDKNTSGATTAASLNNNGSSLLHKIVSEQTENQF